jgi:putative ABC transport system ATP-binding protein
MGYIRQYWVVVRSGPDRPASGQPPLPSDGRIAGAAIEMREVVCRGGAAEAGHGTGAAGVSLQVPAGQSLALLSQPRAAATDLFDVIAGLRRPEAGLVRVGGIAVSRLTGAELDRYRASRGLVSPRFPLLGSLSAADNVLAARPAGRAGAPAADLALRMLEFTGASSLTGPVHRLSVEEQWRIMIARALVSSPQLLLAEDPSPSLDQRAADRVLDVLMDAHASHGFTLVLAADRPTTAARCQRRVLVAHGTVAEDDITFDDAWTRSRIDRIGLHDGPADYDLPPLALVVDERAVRRARGRGSTRRAQGRCRRSGVCAAQRWRTRNRHGTFLRHRGYRAWPGRRTWPR